MPSKWIGGIHKGQVGKRWSQREKTYRYNPEDKSCNSGRAEYDIRMDAEFATAPTKQDWPSSFSLVSLPSVSTRARKFVIIVGNRYTDQLKPDVVSTTSGLTAPQTDKLAMGARCVVESFQGLRVSALRRSSHNCERDT